MRIIIRPVADRQREIDLTQRLIAAIAEELWRLFGGNEQLNWLEAEMHLRTIVGQARAEACATETLVAAPPGAATASQRQPIVAMAEPPRPRRSTRGAGRTVSRPSTARAGQRQMAISA